MRSFATSMPVVSKSKNMIGLEIFNFICLVIKHHRHQKHQEVVVLLLLSRSDDTCTAWISKLEDDVLRSDAVEHVDEEWAIETDAHWRTIVLAHEVLLSACREVDVLCRHCERIVLNVELDECAALACEHADTTKSADERETIDSDAEWVVCWDYRVVVRVAALNETAAHNVVRELDFSVAVVEVDFCLTICLWKHSLEKERRLEGLQLGADDYIAKPFNMDVLLLRIQKFMELTAKSHSEFQKKIDVSPSEITITPLDEQFIEKAVKIVEENMNNTDFTVEAFGKELAMSRSFLYKKLMAITGLGPAEFIRTIRLKRGKALLERSQMHISEIAYTVGFNSLKSFTMNFKAEFGVTPSEYRKTRELNG